MKSPDFNMTWQQQVTWATSLSWQACEHKAEQIDSLDRESSSRLSSSLSFSSLLSESDIMSVSIRGSNTMLSCIVNSLGNLVYNMLSLETDNSEAVN